MLFCIAGYGGREEVYEIVRLNEANKGFVEYLGAVPHELVPNILARSDLFVLPSRYETFGIPALEAQSCGVPVIATNIPGLRDVVIHMKTGLLISPNSASELAKSILWFYELWKNKPDEYENFRLNARKNALNYDWKIIASMVNALLHEVLEEGI
jgi:glycosyltransferase involved in cell wall biosynthesis